MTYLNKMLPGQKAKILGYRKDNPISRRLAELGLIPGREIQYVRNAPLKDPLQIQVGLSSFSLRHAEASLIAVEVEG